MIHTLAFWVFGHLCHQDVARCWAPGGMPLAVCQRCTGIYVGAALMLALLPLMRFKPTRTFHAIHALLLIQMAVLGAHLLPHPPFVSTLSGQLFIAGAFYFVWNSLRYRWTFLQGNQPASAYWAGILSVVVILGMLTHAPWGWVAPALDAAALAGLGVIVVAGLLTFADVVLR